MAPQCDTVHVDGSETGGGAVVVSMTCGGVVRRLPITVWYPDLPLTVDVTDDELNVVKGWRVPAAGWVFPILHLHLLYLFLFAYNYYYRLGVVLTAANGKIMCGCATGHLVIVQPLTRGPV